VEIIKTWSLHRERDAEEVKEIAVFLLTNTHPLNFLDYVVSDAGRRLVLFRSESQFTWTELRDAVERHTDG